MLKVPGRFNLQHHTHTHTKDQSTIKNASYYANGLKNSVIEPNKGSFITHSSQSAASQEALTGAPSRSNSTNV
jgi:hypothetical protein